ncbi:MAG: hypothetical protein ACYDGN_08360 [Acidimicrobiales bacterium]
MADERTLHERLVDLAIYVPIGLAASLAEELPGLADKGRMRLQNQLQTARMIGKFTVAEAQRRVRSRTTAPGTTSPPARASGETAEAPGPAGPLDGDTGSSRGTVRSHVEGADPAQTPDSPSLPIPGYDTLAASQVVQRLGSLRAEELEAVRRYEVATRGRRTILHRIGQLSSSGGRVSA